MISGQAADINFVVFGFTHPRLDPMVYHTQGKHANYY